MDFFFPDESIYGILVVSTFNQWRTQGVDPAKPQIFAHILIFKVNLEKFVYACGNLPNISSYKLFLGRM